MVKVLDTVTNIVKIDSDLEVREEEPLLVIFKDDVTIGVYHSHFDNRVFVTIRKDGKDLYQKSF